MHTRAHTHTHALTRTHARTYIYVILQFFHDFLVGNDQTKRIIAEKKLCSFAWVCFEMILIPSEPTLETETLRTVLFLFLRKCTLASFETETARVFTKIFCFTRSAHVHGISPHGLGSIISPIRTCTQSLS